MRDISDYERSRIIIAKTVADLLVDRLIDWGVDTIIGLPGDGVNGIFEALRANQEKVRFIQVLKFAQALIKGQRNRFEIIKTVLEDKVREVI